MSSDLDLLDPSVKHDVVLETLRRDCEALAHFEFRLSCGFRRIKRDNLHVAMGCARFEDFVQTRFGIAPKLAWTFAFLGEHLERLPLTREAVRIGDLTYTKAREFVRIADERSEGEWIEFALAHTNRELEKKVRGFRAGEGGKKEEEKVPVHTSLTGEQLQAFERSRRALMDELDRPVTTADAIGLLANRHLTGNLDEGSPKALPQAVIMFDPRSLDTWVPTHLGDVEAEFSRWLESYLGGKTSMNFLGEALCDCEGRKHRRDWCPHRSMVQSAKGKPATSRYVPAEVKRRVMIRDGHRCRVPGCRGSGPMSISHLEPFRDGVPMTEEYLACHCMKCNRLIESGRIRVEGLAPFERYYDSSGNYLGIGYDHEPRLYGRPVALSHVGQNGAAVRSELAPVGCVPEPPD